MRPRVKICGITNESDAFAAIDAGASALGFIFAESPRRIEPEALSAFRDRIPNETTCVGVFRGNSESEVKSRMAQFDLDVAQTYDPMDLEFVQWNARTIRDANEMTPARGLTLWDVKAEGSGREDCWKKLSNAAPFAIAGGLSTENVVFLLQSCRPRWIDVASGVEDSPGRKNKHKMRTLIEVVRSFQ